MADKAPGAFLTIGELSAELGVPQHILRYWETRFPKLKPLTRPILPSGVNSVFQWAGAAVA